jgi:hypothetical protein
MLAPRGEVGPPGVKLAPRAKVEAPAAVQESRSLKLYWADLWKKKCATYTYL